MEKIVSFDYLLYLSFFFLHEVKSVYFSNLSTLDNSRISNTFDSAKCVYDDYSKTVSKLIPLHIISSSQFIAWNRYKIMEFVGRLNNFQLYWARVGKRV